MPSLAGKDTWDLSCPGAFLAADHTVRSLIQPVCLT